MNKSIVIGGVPRSGTSVMTDICRKMLGDDRLIGSQFMGRDLEPTQGPRKAGTPIQEYERSKRPKRQETKRDFEEMKDMNPEGFYECSFTVQGMFWSPKNHEMFKKMDAMEKEPFCKIVSNGLLMSDPTRISKIVYMLRCPHEVAKSQEKLKRQHELPEGEVVHSPDFFIQATKQFCRWMRRYAEDVEVLIVEHSALLADPETEVKRVAAFLNEPHNNSWEVVQKKLHRSKPQSIENAQWEDADAIFEMMKVKDYKGVLKYMNNPEINTHKVNARFKCHRTGQRVGLEQCKSCKSNPVVMENYKKTAERNGIDWKNEPCAIDCGALGFNDAISVEDSIENNTWIYKSLGVGTILEKIIAKTGLAKLAGKEDCKGCKDEVKRLDNKFKVKR